MRFLKVHKRAGARRGLDARLLVEARGAVRRPVRGLARQTAVVREAAAAAAREAADELGVARGERAGEAPSRHGCRSPRKGGAFLRLFTSA